MSETATKDTAPPGRPMGAGGTRLAEAFEAVTDLPALAESRRRLLEACSTTTASPGEIAELIESDAALAIVVMRAANNGPGPAGRTGGVPDAIEELAPAGIEAGIARIATYDALEPGEARTTRIERFRRHAVAVRHAAERVAEVARIGRRDEIVVAALLHDVGKLVIAELYGDGHPAEAPGLSPDERTRRERRELGIDHAIVGAVLLRRWGLPGEVAAAVERHHSPRAGGPAGAVRLADLLVHHCAGDPVPAEALGLSAARLGIDRGQLRALSFEFPHYGHRRPRRTAPCPLSAREVDALRGLAEGKVYKQIAHELSLSVSTVRTHLHNVYRKIGAVDRAQAVLLARDRGWI